MSTFDLYMGVDLIIIIIFVGFVPDVIIIAVQTLSNFPNWLPVFVKQLTLFAIELLRSSPSFTTIKGTGPGNPKHNGVASHSFLYLLHSPECLPEDK